MRRTSTLPFALALTVALLATTAIAPSAGAGPRDVPPRAAAPWQQEVARIRAEYDANPSHPRFAKRFVAPGFAADVPMRIAANEAATVDAVLVEWWCNSSGTADDWDAMWMAIIANAIETGADAYVYLRSNDGHDEATTLAACKAMLAQATGVDADAPYWIQGFATNAFWMRDFGPLFVRARAGDRALAIEDPRYYSTRPQDDAQPADFAARIATPISEFPLSYEGGNFLPNGGGLCLASSVVTGRNPQYTLAEIEAMYRDELGCDQVVIVDALQDYATGHVDMWLAWADGDTLLVGEYTEAQDPTNRAIIENNVATKLAGLVDPATGNPIELVRVPMPSNCPGNPAPQSCPSVQGWNRVWRTYLNVLPVNGRVLVPVFDRDDTYEAAALQIWADQGFTVVPVGSDHIITSAGSIHCITKSLDAVAAAPTPTPTPDGTPSGTPTPGPTATPEPSPTPGGPAAENGGGGRGPFGCSVGALAPAAPGAIWAGLLAIGALLARRRRI